MSTVSPNVAYYTSPAYQTPVQTYQSPASQPQQPYSQPKPLTPHVNHNTSVLVEHGRLKRRWFPKQIFSTKAPPEDQVAGAGRMALMAGLLGFCMPPFIAGIPFAVVTYIWQTQRNEDALNNMYKKQAEKDSPKADRPVA